MADKDLPKLAEQLAEKRNRGYSWRQLWNEFEVDQLFFEEQNTLQTLIEQAQKEKGYIVK